MIFFPKNTNNNPHFTKSINDLSVLANEYETDKGTADAKSLSWGKDYPQHSCWHYTKTYQKYMQDKRFDPINMMEIGVCDKRFPFASVKMWMSFFEKANFYAVDNFWGYEIGDRIKDVNQLTDEYGVNFVYADQGSFNDWNDITNLPTQPKFDFLIEDGSHWPNHMMVSLWKSIPVMKVGGYFFMEDIQNPLKSRGWFKYDNSLVAQEFLETLSTKVLYSSFLNDTQNAEVNASFELVDMVLDPKGINYLAVLKRI